MRLLLAGGRGLAGRNMAPFLLGRFDLTILDIEDWDITDRTQGAEVLDRYRPEALVNLAAFTDVEGCETRQEIAMTLNGTAPGILASLCQERGIGLVHFSTDYVFDGEKGNPYREEDPTHPLSVYGATKLAGEKAVLANHPGAIVFRTQWLYGKGGENFISKVTRGARDQGHVRVVNDQRGSPTFARDLALPLAALVEGGHSGIYHVANSGNCTWFDFACEAFSLLGIDAQVLPISSGVLNQKAKRPAYSVFDLSRLEGATGIAMRPWQDALREYLA
jgi:dTDP-4-dehydrorhamnose reductase